MNDAALPPAARKRGRPPRQDAADAIIETATRYFLKFGYSSATMQDIARACGVAKQTIYARFPNKLALFRSVVFSFTENKLKSAFLDFDISQDAEASLNALARVLVMSALDPDTVGMQRLIISELDRAPEIAEILHVESARLALTLVKDVMKILVDRSELYGDPEDLAIWFFDLSLMRHIRDALFRTKPMEKNELLLLQQKAAISFFLQSASR